MIIALQILSLFCVLAAFIPLSGATHWIVRSFDFPRIQMAVITGLALATHLLLPASDATPIVWPAALAVALLIQAKYLIPFTKVWRKAAPASATEDKPRRFRVLVANVLMTNTRHEELVTLIERADADIILTLETNDDWATSLREIEEDYPYRMACPKENLYGMHLYSRLPLSNADTRFLIDDDVPSFHCTATLHSGDKVRLHGMHPPPPSPTEKTTSEPRDAELLILGRELADATMPTVVFGDLNDVAWSPTTQLFKRFSGLRDPRVGRGFFNSYNAKWFFVRWPLDHLFVSDHFSISAVQRLPKFGSDHFPILSELQLESSRAITATAASQLEVDEADELIDDQTSS